MGLGQFASTASANDGANVPSGPPPVETGFYLVHAAGCADCHTTKENRYMAGGVVLNTPFGTITTPNITPDPNTGIGNWTYEDFERALRKGRSPHQQFYYPVFPFRSYAKISDVDMRKMWDYLKSVNPIISPNIPSQMKVPRIGSLAWEALFWWNVPVVTTPDQRIMNGDGPFQPIPARGEEWNRGAYIAESLTHCAECHTPRDPYLGKLDLNQWMAGGIVEDQIVPNITPDPKTGRGSWGEKEWDRFLKFGHNPKRDHELAETMAEVVQNTSALTDSDRHALIVYLRALKPIERGADA